MREQPRAALGPPKIYYFHPLLAGPLPSWRPHLDRIAGLGFTHVNIAPPFLPGAGGNVLLTDDFEKAHPLFEEAGSADELVAKISAACREFGLSLLIDIVLDRVARGGVMARSAPRWFREPETAPDAIDPRRGKLAADAADANFADPDAGPQLTAWWIDRLVRLAQAGAAGFRLLGLDHAPAPAIAGMLDAVRKESRQCRFLGWTPGIARDRLAALQRVGFDHVFGSTPWWDGRAPWFVEEYEALRRLAPVIGVAAAPFDGSASRWSGAASAADDHRRVLRTAAATGDGILVPMGFEFAAPHMLDAGNSRPEDFSSAQAEAELDLSGDIKAANALVDTLAALNLAGEMRQSTGPASPVTALLKADARDVRAACRGIVVLINPDDRPHPLPLSLDPLGPEAGAAFGHPQSLDGADVGAPLAPNEVRILSVEGTQPVVARTARNGRALTEAAKAPRIVIDRIEPRVEGGPFAVKRVVGQTATVEADVFTDGHDLLGVELLWRAADEKDWKRAPLNVLGNDRWRGTFTPTRIGRHLFTVEAWRDDFGTLCRDIKLKTEAGADIALELVEARQYLEAVRTHAVACNTTALGNALGVLAGDDPAASVTALTSPETRAAVAASQQRAFAAQHSPVMLDVERPQAEFASWYELFPRSQSGDPARHGTFDDVIARLPDIRAMGFDVLYFPPIHPIGRTNRKGRNNSLTPGPDDHGSPYAIGSDEGGHDAIHRQLGTLDDFRRLIAAARAHGLEIALDFAVQCSPDHPWLRAHPDWFRWRPDGSVKYAENPPKKYQDIVNVDFYAEGAIPGLWIALRDIVLFWADEGVRTFRVDNPHTKPLPFWQWMIADVRARHPDLVFLSEAFTRPKEMYRLAKLGFSQSYTYFTWRNHKQELTEYLTELTTTDVREFFRPHFFVNTPDINPYF
ncbi:MAG: DUF3416 domain-containing protein, partial [Alphaproteobacteria bacterium]